MRTRSIMLLALALGCGLVASIGISQMMDARSKSADDGERTPVFVAMGDIRPNEELTAQNIKLEEWPKNIIPQGALTKLEDVEGKKVRIKIYAGEPILSSKLLGADDVTGAAKDIPPGYRVANVKVDPVSGSSNLILPGDRVDVLVFKHPNADINATAAKIVLQDLKVFAVDTHTETEFTATKDEQTEPMTAKTISLLVTPQQAVILHAASEIGGAVRLVLRNPDDEEHVAAQGATINDIFGSETDRSDRQGEKGTTTGSEENETSDIASWLTEQSGKQKGNLGATTPIPAVPPVPGQRKTMIVLLGAELVSIEIPEKGGLPVVTAEDAPADLGGDQPSTDEESQPPSLPPQGPGEQDETDQEDTDGAS